MSAEFPSLAEVILRHVIKLDYYGPGVGCAGCDWISTNSFARAAMEDHTAHRVDMWREACTIRTVEQLDALPNYAVVGMRMPAILPSDSPSHLFAIEKDGGWFGVGSGDEIEPGELAGTLAVTTGLLLWHPDWAQP